MNSQNYSLWLLVSTYWVYSVVGASCYQHSFFPYFCVSLTLGLRIFPLSRQKRVRDDEENAIIPWSEVKEQVSEYCSDFKGGWVFSSGSRWRRALYDLDSTVSQSQHCSLTWSGSSVKTITWRAQTETEAEVQGLGLKLRLLVSGMFACKGLALISNASQVLMEEECW